MQHPDDYAATALRLCEIQNTDFGWGLYLGEDNSHLPITGEVASALRFVPASSADTRNALDKAREYLLSWLQKSTLGPQSLKSTIHLCWLVLGSLAVGISVDHPAVLELLAVLLDSQAEAWGWKLKAHGGRADGNCLYPTYLALRTIREAQDAGWPQEVPSVEQAAAWILAAKDVKTDLWGSREKWGDGETTLEKTAVATAYALMALKLAGRPADPLTSTSLIRATEAALLAKRAIVSEVGKGRGNNHIPWNHFVLAQVILAHLNHGSMDLLETPSIARLMCRMFTSMYSGSGVWLDQLRGAECESPYIGADALSVMVLWSERLHSPSVAARIAVQFGAALDAATGPPKPSELLEDPVLVTLRRSLRRHYRTCNRLSLDLAGRRLFNSSNEAYDELLEETLLVPVGSRRDFRVFIIDLYMVFDEGIDEEVRRWRPGQELRQPLSAVAAFLHQQEFRQLAVLRHKLAAHDAFQGKGSDAAQALSQVTMNLIGRRSIAPDDCVSWLALQKSTLQMIERVLKAVVDIFENDQASPTRI